MKLNEAIDIRVPAFLTESQAGPLEEAAPGVSQRGRYMGFTFEITKTETGYHLVVDESGVLTLEDNVWTVTDHRGKKLGTITDRKPMSMDAVKIGDLINLLVRMRSDEAEYGRVLNPNARI